MRFGRQLREERERLEVSLEEIARVTRVPLRQLHSLEADLFDELPPGVVRRGLLRSYCRHLGLEEDLWMERFATAGGLPDDTQDPEKLAEFAENIRRGRASSNPVRIRWLWVLLMLAALAAAAFAAWQYVLQPRIFPANTAPVTPPVSSLALPPPASGEPFGRYLPRL